MGEEQSNLLFAREYYDTIDADDGMMVSVCFCFVFSNAGILVLVFAKFNTNAANTLGMQKSALYKYLRSRACEWQSCSSH